MKPSPANVRRSYDDAPFIHNRRTLKQQEAKKKLLEASVKTTKKKPFDINNIKNMSLQELFKTDMSYLDSKMILQKYGEPTVFTKANGEEVIVKHLNTEDYIRILTPQFKSHDTRMSYFNFRRYAEIFIEESTEIEESTRKQRRSWLNTILDFFLRADIPLTWKKFDRDFYKAYGKWLMYGKRDGVNENDLFNNSFGSHIKRLRTFLEWCDAEQGIELNPIYKKFKVLSEEKEVIYLDPQEIDMLWFFKMPEIKGFENKPWRLIQDIAVFGALTGLRISDIKRSRFNLEVLRRDRTLEAKTQKTRCNYYIPIDLDPRIELILKKYEYDLNLIGEQEFNKLIKKVLEQLYKHHDIHQTLIKHYKYKFKEEFLFENYKYELYTSHCNRRSAVTNWYFVHGFSEQEILVLLGSKSLTEIKKYISKNPYKVKASVLRKLQEQKQKQEDSFVA
jgi:hypothetical protein